jgi:hypothetical protein
MRWQGWVVSTQIGGLECWLAQNKIQERSVVGLDDKEEDLLERDVKQRWTDNDMAGIAPDACANEVRVPRKGRGDGNLHLLARMAFQRLRRWTYAYEEENLEDINLGEQGTVQQRKQHSRRDGVFGMAVSWLVALSSSNVAPGCHVHKRIVIAHSVGGAEVVWRAQRDVQPTSIRTLQCEGPN